MFSSMMDCSPIVLYTKLFESRKKPAKPITPFRPNNLRRLFIKSLGDLIMAENDGFVMIDVKPVEYPTPKSRTNIIQLQFSLRIQIFSIRNRNILESKY